MSASEPRAQLTRGQTIVLAAATVPMIGAGVAGGWGTYTNIVTEFGRAATALGVVAAGEGVTLVLALVMVGLTMLGQAAPAPVRAGLWLAPIAAALTGVVVADDTTEAVVYALTPMAMSASAEGLGLLARRIVVHRTGVDMEVQRRNAATVQRLAYHRARAANHPGKVTRWRSERASWRLAKQVGVGDTELGAQLVEVQRDRLTGGADAALLDMFTVASGVAPAAVEVTVERVDDEQPPLSSEAEPAPVEAVAPPAITAPQSATQPTYQLDHSARHGVPSEPADPWGDVPSVYDMRVPDWTVPGDYWKGDPVLDPKPVNVTTQAAPQEPHTAVTEPEPEHHAPVTETVTQQSAAVPAKESRQVVTEQIGLNPTELRRQARQLHNKVVKSGGRGVTIDQLRDEFGLSRREATELRRTVVSGDQS
ncbi:conjugal transfer protein [Streptomyces atratus]|uniref:conjugal transfer protein n=1 Tax=Streptomyces atratus TaxID=1893 RepID=UPI0033FC2E41